ncbi:MlrC C-terminal domain-containing protein [Streptomyces pseudovenezuelae]|uniref:MlrC C-terminal domain-containing protein n=1 Tax=Streptomyces pseudovenezuelae TaxID=67350 RepID=UPI0036F077DD
MGAEADGRHAGPLTLTGAVHANRHGGEHAVSGYVVLARLRESYHSEHDFAETELAPPEAGLVLVEIGRAEAGMFAGAAGRKMARTPGGADQDLPRLRHRRVRRPMVRFDRGMTEGELT